MKTYKLTIYNILSIIVLSLMLCIQFTPWLSLYGQTYSMPYWFTQMQYILTDLVGFTIIYLLMWLYSCFTIPTILLFIIKKNHSKPIFSILTSFFAIITCIASFIFTFIQSEASLTIAPIILAVLAIANFIITIIGRKSANNN